MGLLRVSAQKLSAPGAHNLHPSPKQCTVRPGPLAPSLAPRLNEPSLSPKPKA